MTRKSLGYVELEWTCRRCGTKNPGLTKTCTNCGDPMPEKQEFELPEQQQILQDEAKIEEAKKGPDIHCPYCGARNPAGSPSCSQCSGDLSEGAVRQAGKVLGAHQAGEIPKVACPYCSAQIPANSQRCPNCAGDLAPQAAKPVPAAPQAQKLPVWMIALAAVFLVICCGGVGIFALLSLRTSDVSASVQDVSWQRMVEIQEQRQVQESAWEDSLPADAQNISCRDEYRETRPNPAPNSTEVCGTPYTLDTGSGAGEVVQDCEYRVYDSFCEYEVLKWVTITQATAQGNDLQPYWPVFDLQGNQREGQRSENYTVIFSADSQGYEYTTTNASEFSQYIPGSQWTLKVNSFGSVTSVTP
jgi:DNA-directed RNA polymerase subunit RPC12/RpoP